MSVQLGDIKKLSAGYFFYTLPNLRNKIISCNKTPESFACLDLDYILKAVLRILIVKVLFILPLVLK